MSHSFTPYTASTECNPYTYPMYREDFRRPLMDLLQNFRMQGVGTLHPRLNREGDIIVTAIPDTPNIPLTEFRIRVTKKAYQSHA